MNDRSTAVPKPLQPTMESNSQARRVLGEVSPNIKAVQSLTRPMMGSPLKRSFTAMSEHGAGFQYLKKRKGSGENAFDQSAPLDKSRQPQGSPRRVFKHIVVEEVPTIEVMPEDEQPVPQSTNDLTPPIQEPSPTEPNTPSSLEDDREETQSSSLDRKSFSSLINYEPSSQIPQCRTTSGTHFPPISRAEMLRLRLRVAMYKVRTNQIDIPFSQLESSIQKHQNATSRAVEEAVAQLRREAQLDLARQQQKAAENKDSGTATTTTQPETRSLKLLPAPVLLPTAYSSRMIYEPGGLPSSPPVAATSPDRSTAEATPRPQRAMAALEPDLTSSVVKGRVAEGLLGLRNAA